jgi:hypothetical protein
MASIAVRIRTSDTPAPKQFQLRQPIGGLRASPFQPGGRYLLPLHHAAHCSSSPAVVALLLARGPAGSVRAESVHGNTPLALAEEFSG